MRVRAQYTRYMWVTGGYREYRFAMTCFNIETRMIGSFAVLRRNERYLLSPGSNRSFGLRFGVLARLSRGGGNGGRGARPLEKPTESGVVVQLAEISTKSRK